MRRVLIGFSLSVLLMGGSIPLVAAKDAMAGVDVGISVNLGPPPIVVPAPPAVVLLPGSSVYFVPGLEFDVFFHNGYWWSPRGDRWYRSRAYNGPWRIIDRRYIPGPVFRVPHDYRNRYVRERHIPYREWREHRQRMDRREVRERRHDRREQRHDRREQRRDDGDRGRHGHGH